MLLSICMMVKNEEKNLDRSLKSMLPILDGIDSELIIVDTGSSDNTVQIAKNYTDKVYFHEWNNDFSGMRNKSISYAKGEWIFIIDADESVEDAKEILVFLKSKYTKGYNCCNLTVKNITNKDEYVLLSSPRIFKNDGYFHYEGKIHNDPIFKGPVLTLDTVLVHTGYISTDKELMERKFKRTSSILKEELRKDPENVYYGFQLSVSYSMHKDHKKALEQIEKTYDIFSRKKLDKAQHIYLYYQLAVCNLRFDDIKNYKKVEKYCIEGIEVESEHIDLYFCLAKAYMLMDKYEEAVEYYSKYFELIDNYSNLNIRYNILIQVYSENKKDEAYYDCAGACFELHDYKNCMDYIEKISSEKYIKKIAKIAVAVFVSETKFDRLKKFYDKVTQTSDEDFIRSFLNILEGNVIKLKKEKYINYLEHFSKDNDTYCYLNKIRKMYEDGNNDYGIMITQFVNEFPLSNQPGYFGDLVYFKMKLEEDIYDMLSKVSASKIEDFIKYIANKYDDFNDTICNYVSENVNSNFYTERVKIILERFILVLDKIDEKTYKNVFNDYVQCGTDYINTIYNREVLDERIIYDVKNDEEVFFIFMNKANEVKDYDEKEYIRYLRKALAVYPFMKKGIEMLLNELKNEMNATSDEFEDDKVKVKNTIKALIENNKLNEANKVIQEYENIVKDDMEIVFLKSQISLKKLKNPSTVYKM
ncbi:glycosyltransferase [Clostridium autoethanogenum]|uniref:Glycosyltransferase n=1 Tax=Clostridium autoethanogenum TaxID=84023 RepID=A0A3M0T121_9CLOT|nr:glycosyltransferase [Clostridium autoethanogenum]RMD04334.1 glycosyltransferase [Clostridium autoethanogenum]